MASLGHLYVCFWGNLRSFTERNPIINSGVAFLELLPTNTLKDENTKINVNEEINNGLGVVNSCCVDFRDKPLNEWRSERVNIYF